jgi:hypothetical protein
MMTWTGVLTGEVMLCIFKLVFGNGQDKMGYNMGKFKEIKKYKIITQQLGGNGAMWASKDGELNCQLRDHVPGQMQKA